MLIYIDLEHPSIWSDAVAGAAHQQKRMRDKLRFEELSGLPCLLMRYPFALDGWVQRLRPAGLLLSGMSTDWEHYELGWAEGMARVIRAWDGPMIGFCGGHQLIAHAYGAEIGPMRSLRASEPDARPDFGSGFFKESGFLPVRVVAEDELFAGLPSEISVCEEHYWEVKALPEGFVLLAATESCRVQAFRLGSRLVYGTQFHPERFDDAHPEGGMLLRNFFAQIGVSGSRAEA